MNLLFTGVGRRVELIQTFREASLVLDKTLRIYGSDIDETAPALGFCDYALTLPAMDDSKYIEKLLQLCREKQIDCVIPTIDTDLLALAESKQRFLENGTRILVSDPETICTCQDKIKTAKLFKNIGLISPSSVTDWREYRDNYPAFIKPREGSGSINALRVEDKEELAFYASRIPDYIIQPFIPGHEFTVDIFCDWNGDPITVVPRERLQVRAGEVLKTRISLDSKINDECQRLCKTIKPIGPLAVQLIRNDAGVDWYIEINPRFGGGAPLSMKAGARSAEAILRLIDGEHAGEYQIADGAIYSRFDQSVCITEGKGQIKGVIFDLDDTLYSEKEYVRSGYKAVSDYLGGGYEERLWSFFEDCKPAIDELLREIGRETEKQECLNIYRSHKPDIHLYPGVVELIGELKAREIKIGIITDGRPEGQRNKMEELGLDVDDVIITDELGGIQFRKPCDIAFRIMARRWKCNPADIVYVGDNPEKDLKVPQKLGMKTVYFCNSEGLYSGEASTISVNCISELRNKLLYG